jgi:Aspartyl protease
MDKNTSLPMKAIFSGPEDLDINTAYDEGRWTSGVFYPADISVSEGDKSLSEYHLSWSLLTSDIDATVFAPLIPDASDVAADADVVTLPFTLEDDHIILQAQVNGRPAIGFILDTGDDHETINTSRMASFGLTSYGSIHTEGGGGPADMSFATGATFTFPGVELRDQHVSVLDQSGLERALGIPLGGLLGYDFLSRFVVEIDYEGKTLKLHNPNGWRYAGKGVIVPITFDDDGIPYFDAVLSVPTKPNLSAHMVMDFGAAETLTLTSPFVKANNLIRLAGTNTKVATPAGLEKQFFTQNNMRGQIAELRLGGVVARSIPVNMSANSTGAYASPNLAGTIGEGIFSRYHIFLDYPRHRVLFENTAKSDRVFPERKTFGVSLVASGPDLHTFTVSAVRSGSAAESAGFRKADVIVGFDDKRAEQFSLGELRSWLLREGERHLIRINRDGQESLINAPLVLVSIDRK